MQKWEYSILHVNKRLDGTPNNYELSVIKSTGIKTMKYRNTPEYRVQQMSEQEVIQMKLKIVDSLGEDGWETVDGSFFKRPKE